MTEQTALLNRRLEDAGWGLFLAMIGVLWLVPDAIVPQGTWMVGAGLILIGVNIVRYAKRIPISGFSTWLGGFAVAAGLISIAGVHVPLFPMFLIAIGVVIVVKTLVPHHERHEPQHV
jgi:hypothetical protein